MQHKKWLLTSLLLAAIAGVIFSSPCSALSSNISSPFDIDTAWNICQGYSNVDGTHTGASTISLDITGGPGCDNSAAGKNVRSPFSGKVSWYSANSGSLCVSHPDGRSIMLTHIDSTITNGITVADGQIIGTIAAPFQRQNNGVAHLHLQAWPTAGCSGTSIPFDSAHRMRMCGAPDMTLVGPDQFDNGIWSGVSFTTQSCTFITKKLEGSIYRFWSDINKHHFYTADYNEAQRVADTWPDIWSYEPTADFQVIPLDTNGFCSENSHPVYRFWSDRYRGHFYTIDSTERDRVVATWPDVWTYEGPKYCASKIQTTEATKPVYRFWSDLYMGHFYTSDEAEKNRVIATWPDVWTYEGPRFYVK